MLDFWQREDSSNSHYVGQTSGLPAPRYRGAVIIVLTVAVPLAPRGVENLVRRQISVLKMRIAGEQGYAIDDITRHL